MSLTTIVTKRGKTRHIGGCDIPVTRKLTCGCTTGGISSAILTTLRGLTRRTRLARGFRTLCGKRIIGAKRGHLMLRRVAHKRLKRTIRTSNMSGHAFCMRRRGGVTRFTGGMRTNRVAGNTKRGFAAIIRVNVNKDSLNPHTVCLTLRG